VGAGKIALSLDRQVLWRAMDRLGFGQLPHSGFPGEASGRLNPARRWAQIDQATLAFGYGISVSTLQLARAYGALAHDGLLLPATLLKREQPPEGSRVFAPEVARAVRRMLESVAGPDGTAPQAAVTGYRIAGKTGTVKKLGADGYSDDRYQSLFVGIAPAREPRVVVAVVIDEPRAGRYYGGQVAGPVFSAVMAETLRLLNVEPDAMSSGPVRLASARRDAVATEEAVQ
jgi:cell division protein FtsI (penicillin-binding protein 3)